MSGLVQQHGGNEPTLGALLQGEVDCNWIPQAARQTPVAGLSLDSRTVDTGEVFFAFPGLERDGREFARSALDKGAVIVLFEQEQAPHACLELARQGKAVGVGKTA